MKTLIILAATLVIGSETYTTIGSTTFGPSGPGITIGNTYFGSRGLSTRVGRHWYGPRYDKYDKVQDNFRKSDEYNYIKRSRHRKLVNKANKDARLENSYKMEIMRLKHKIEELEELEELEAKDKPKPKIIITRTPK